MSKKKYYMDKCKYCTAPDSNCEYWCGTFCSYDLEIITNEDASLEVHEQCIIFPPKNVD